MGKDFSYILLNESRDTGATKSAGVAGTGSSLCGSNGAVHGPEGCSE